MKKWSSSSGFWGLVCLGLGVLLVASGLVGVYFQTMHDYNAGLIVNLEDEHDYGIWEDFVATGLLAICIGIIIFFAQGVVWLIQKATSKNFH